MKKSKLPGTDSIRKLAEFWDNHDLADFEDELEEVGKPVFVRGSSIKVPLKSGEAASRGKNGESQRCFARRAGPQLDAKTPPSANHRPPTRARCVTCAAFRFFVTRRRAGDPAK